MSTQELGTNQEQFWTELKEKTLESSKIDSPQINNVDPAEIGSILDRGIEMIREFEKAALPHPPVHTDTDVVFIIPGPGEYSLKIAPHVEKPDRYRHLPWTRKMDRARIRFGVVLVQEITAQRLGKPVKEVTREDIVMHGPYLHYASTQWEDMHLKEMLRRNIVKLPEEKIFTYTHIKGRDGATRPIINTADQLEGLEFPEGLNVRRIAVVAHAPHLVRALYMMGKYKERIPENTIVQPFPLRTPRSGQFEFARMELQGVLAAIYKLGRASNEPHPYKLD